MGAAPPLVGVAVNVTDCVAQIVVADATILTLVAVVGSIVNVSELLVTGFAGIQVTPFTESTQVITSPLIKSE